MRFVPSLSGTYGSGADKAVSIHTIQHIVCGVQTAFVCDVVCEPGISYHYITHINPMSLIKRIQQKKPPWRAAFSYFVGLYFSVFSFGLVLVPLMHNNRIPHFDFYCKPVLLFLSGPMNHSAVLFILSPALKASSFWSLYNSDSSSYPYASISPVTYSFHSSSS